MPCARASTARSVFLREASILDAEGLKASCEKTPDAYAKVTIAKERIARI
jgi:hypothetical protein